jgi:hypothetical protein
VYVGPKDERTEVPLSPNPVSSTGRRMDRENSRDAIGERGRNQRGAEHLGGVCTIDPAGRAYRWTVRRAATDRGAGGLFGLGSFQPECRGDRGESLRSLRPARPGRRAGRQEGSPRTSSPHRESGVRALRGVPDGKSPVREPERHPPPWFDLEIASGPMGIEAIAGSVLPFFGLAIASGPMGIEADRGQRTPLFWARDC